LLISFILSGYTKKEMTMKISGYYPYTASKNEKHIEGGKFDCFGHKLQWLYSNEDYISVAVDPKVIPLNSYLIIDAFPNKIFKACDKGKAIKGLKLDICVWDKKTAFNLPKKSKITIIDKKYIGLKIKDNLAFLGR